MVELTNDEHRLIQSVWRITGVPNNNNNNNN